MQERKITLLINPDGSTSVEVDGVKGTSCTELTKELLENLGNVTATKEKAELRQITATTAAAQRLGRV